MNSTHESTSTQNNTSEDRMDDRFDKLKWDTSDTKMLLHTPVFDVLRQHEVSRTGLEGDYVTVQAPEWVVVVAEHEGNLLLVHQWRHGADEMTLEFPGGVVEPNEDTEHAAHRELLEETGYRAEKMTFLGRVWSNPALFKNRFCVYLAENLTDTGSQNLDDDELLKFEARPIAEVIAGFGKQGMTHAFMGTALAFYMRHKLGK